MKRPHLTLVADKQSGAWSMQPCPVQALGVCGDTFYFIDTLGQRRELTASKLDKRNILALFGGDDRWLSDNFPFVDRKGEVQPGFSAAAAAQELMRLCTMRGVYDASRGERYIGIWRDGDRPVIHAGDAIYLNGAWGPAGVVVGGELYLRAPAIEQPAMVAPNDPEQEQQLLRLIDKSSRGWNFEHEVGRKLFLGAIGAGCLGAFPRWRSHLFLQAPHGAGKTTAARFAASIFGDAVLGPLMNVSEAGLRQKASGRGLPIIMDEAEERGSDPHRLDKVIELIRTSSLSGGHILRGTAGGTAVSFSLASPVLLMAIVPPKLSPQDASRITLVRMKPLAVGPEALIELEKALAVLSEGSAIIRGRILRQADRWDDTVALYRTELMSRGLTARMADQAAGLLAGFDLLFFDALPFTDSVTEAVDEFLAAYPLSPIDALLDSEGGECLAQLLGAQIELGRREEVVSLAQAIGMVAEDADGSAKAEKALALVGVKVIKRGDRRENWQVAVANGGSAGLKSLFEGTRWQRNQWREALRILPGAARGAQLHFAGVQSRCTLLPLSLVLPPEILDGGDAGTVTG